MVGEAGQEVGDWLLRSGDVFGLKVCAVGDEDELGAGGEGLHRAVAELVEGLTDLADGAGSDVDGAVRRWADNAPARMSDLLSVAFAEAL